MTFAGRGSMRRTADCLFRTFVSFIGPGLDDILCEQHERTVSKDNCICFEGLTLQIPLIATGVIISRPGYGSIAIPMALWRFSTAPAGWPGIPGGTAFRTP